MESLMAQLRLALAGSPQASRQCRVSPLHLLQLVMVLLLAPTAYPQMCSTPPPQSSLPLPGS